MSIPQTLYSHPPQTVDSLCTVREAALTMLEHDIGAVIVLENGKIVGILSERDLMTKMVTQDRFSAETLVHEIMTPHVITVTLKQTVDDALRLMSEHHIRHLPLVDATDRPIGMLSFRELYQYCLKKLDAENNVLASLVKIDSHGG